MNNAVGPELLPVSVTQQNRFSVMRIVICLITALYLNSGVYASGGVLEINQTCALNGGCFAGDSEGFPVEITTPGSYRLTGNLDISGFPDSQGIFIAAPYVTLDLNGFEIAGSASCTGTGPTLDCGTPGIGTGIRVDFDANGTVIRNGTIRNMSASGVSANDTRVIYEGLRAYHNARDGFNGGRSSIARNCIAEDNGDVGFEFGLASVIEGSIALGNGSHGFQIDNFKGVVAQSTSRGNGGRGFELGHSSKFRDNTSDQNSDPDRCGGGICTDQKRFYLTSDAYNGSEAMNVCEDGFHFASIYEVLDVTNLAYDHVLGLTTQDSGVGPVALAIGWMRSGSGFNGNSNCDGWASSDSEHRGLSTLFLPSVLTDAAQKGSPWSVIFDPCSFQNRVWCIEN